MSTTTNKLYAGEKLAGWHVLEVVKKTKQTSYLCRCVCGTEVLVAGITLWNRKRLDCGCGRWSGVDGTKLKVEQSAKKTQQAAKDTDEVSRLVEQGFLPTPDAYAVTTGEAVWGMEAVAKILGTETATLMEVMTELGDRFTSGTRLSNDDKGGGTGI